MKNLFKKSVSLFVLVVILFSTPNYAKAATTAVLTQEDPTTHYKFFEYQPTYILPCGQSMYLEDVDSDSWYLEKGQSMQIFCNLDGAVPVKVTVIRKDPNPAIVDEYNMNGCGFAFSIYAFTSGSYQIMLTPTTDLDMWLTSYSTRMYYPEIH